MSPEADENADDMYVASISSNDAPHDAGTH